MSFAHLILLILHYHIILTTSRKKKGRDFVGLILTAWITAAALGCVNTLDLRIRSIVVLVIFVLISIIVVYFYVYVVQKHMKKEAILVWYIDTFLYIEEGQEARQLSKEQWNLKLLGMILISFIVCSLPWMVFNVIGFHKKFKLIEHSISLSVYALTHYIPSTVCIFMKYKDFKISEENTSLERSYRLRHYSRRSQENLIGSDMELDYRK